jgi:hypothetical protein
MARPLPYLVNEYLSYLDVEKRPYVHLLDGAARTSTVEPSAMLGYQTVGI